MSAIRFFAYVVLAIGFAGAATGFFLYAAAALPFQDATPELLTKQIEDIRTGQTLLFGGLLVILAAAMWLWNTRLSCR